MAKALSPRSEHFLRAEAALRETAALGPVADLACGRGRHAIAAAEMGLPTLAFDRSEVLLRQLAEEARARDLPLAAICCDLEAGHGIPVRPGSCGAILVFRFLFRRLAPAIEEALAPGGILLLLSPQYGGPLGASPCRQGGGAGRFLCRLLRAHLPRRGTEMGWQRVAPTVLDGAPYDGDRDAVIEPELTGLVRYLSHLGLEPEVTTSGLEWASWLDYPGSLPQQLARAVCERLGRMGVPPYRNFGPVVAVAARQPLKDS